MHYHAAYLAPANIPILTPMMAFRILLVARGQARTIRQQADGGEMSSELEFTMNALYDDRYGLPLLERFRRKHVPGRNRGWKRPRGSKRRGFALVAAVTFGAALALPAAPSFAHDGEHHVFEAGDVTFNPGPPTLPEGAEFAVLVGSPAEEGPFVMRLKFPAGYEIPPHFHPKEENVTVLSGGFGMAMGEDHDRSAAPIYPAGTFIQIPVGEAHFAWTEEETVVQLNSIGPFGVQYVNAEDDPRNN